MPIWETEVTAEQSIFDLIDVKILEVFELKNMKQTEGDSRFDVSPPSLASGRADKLRPRHTGPEGDSQDGKSPLSFKLRSNWRRRQSRWEKD